MHKEKVIECFLDYFKDQGYLTMLIAYSYSSLSAKPKIMDYNS